jgi:hypothetical protein
LSEASWTRTNRRNAPEPAVSAAAFLCDLVHFRLAPCDSFIKLLRYKKSGTEGLLLEHMCLLRRFGRLFGHFLSGSGSGSSSSSADTELCSQTTHDRRRDGLRVGDPRCPLGLLRQHARYSADDLARFVAPLISGHPRLLERQALRGYTQC